MIRFRLGQSWKNERTESPVDSFSLVVDGVDLLRGASEESLTSVVPEAVAAIHALARKHQRFAQLSLPEAHLEVLFRRTGASVQVMVVNLGRPPRVVQGPVEMDLSELATAAVKGGRTLGEDLRAFSPKTMKSARVKQMHKHLTALEGAVGDFADEAPPSPGFSHHARIPGPLAVGFSVYDEADQVRQLERTGEGALHTLLCPGEISFWPGKSEEPLWTSRVPPFLAVLELTRQANDLWHAVETGESQFSFTPASEGSDIQLLINAGELRTRGNTHPLDARLLVRNIFDLGLEWVLAMASRSKAQAKNPYLIELAARCREGLSHFSVINPDQQTAEARARPQRSSSRPIAAKGKLRKLQFSELWEKHALGGESPGRILLGALGPIFSSPECACGFSPEGALLFRRIATQGAAASADGSVIIASQTRIEAYSADHESARWLRDHDGLSVGPDLEAHEGVWLVPTNSRGLLAYCRHTGRELWRVVPPRTQRAFFTLQGHRALLATDSGYLFGLDAQNGQVRYRMRAAVPFIGPAVPFGKRLLATVGRDGRVVLFCADAHTGALLWTQEFDLDRATSPMAARERIYLAGEREAQGVLLCLGGQGNILWERALQIGRGPYALSKSSQGVLISSGTGETEFLDSDGQVQWRLGATNTESTYPLPAVWTRGVVVLPGESIRAVDPKSGRVLGSIQVGGGLVDLKVDAKLNVYVLDDDGTLRAFRLVSHLAVLSGGDDAKEA